MARRPSASAKREKTRRERTYGPAEVAAGLTAFVQRGSLKAAAKETGIPWETIRDWRKDPDWAVLEGEIRHAHAAEIESMGTAAARDAAEGLQEAILRCRQGLRKATLSDRDAALIGRTLSGVLLAAHRMRDPEKDEPKQIRVRVCLGHGVGETDECTFAEGEED